MAKSVKEHYAKCKTVICIVEEEIPGKALEYSHFDHLVLAKDLGIDLFTKKYLNTRQ
ncbi:hypothetical protein KHA80_18550 [Anaerobacillus sp. HL2]|nr:hypothetical protein KHA80_18550 [Anaerobacillus sp. HL2]